MTAPVPPTSEPDTSARICRGDQIGPCSSCRRPTHKYGSGARSPLCEFCDAKAVQRWGRKLRAD
ncbi:zinc finger domain-containing protein [Streptomyces rochei]|jgi:LSD1 subclass zinc finger protein|uniref:zinc finger domain-containing protein n=1 Tax=Streptomyces rochei TaxID=1928 RepID=UPI0033A7A9AB